MSFAQAVDALLEFAADGQSIPQKGKRRDRFDALDREAAAHHHRQASHHHDHGKHDDAKEHAGSAHEHSEHAAKHSKNAHDHSHK